MNTFTLDGKNFQLKTYCNSDVCHYLLDKLGGTADRVTVTEFNVLKTMLNLGFTPHLSFYGNSNLLYPQLMWYTFRGVELNANGDYGNYLDIEVCYNYNETTNNIVIYEGGKRNCKIGVFSSINDVAKIFRLSNYIPAKITPKGNTVTKIIDRVAHYEIDYHERAKGNTVENPVEWNSFAGYFGDGEIGEFTYAVDFDRLDSVDIEPGNV